MKQTVFIFYLLLILAGCTNNRSSSSHDNEFGGEYSENDASTEEVGQIEGADTHAQPRQQPISVNGKTLCFKALYIMDKGVKKQAEPKLRYVTFTTDGQSCYESNMDGSAYNPIVDMDLYGDDTSVDLYGPKTVCMFVRKGTDNSGITTYEYVMNMAGNQTNTYIWRFNSDYSRMNTALKSTIINSDEIWVYERVGEAESTLSDGGQEQFY